MILEYRRSPEYEKLAASTKRSYERGLKYIEPFYPIKITAIRRRHIIKLRDHFKDTPAEANLAKAVFSRILNYAVHLEYIETSPAYKVEKLQGGHYVRWSDDAIEYAINNLPDRFSRAIILALYTGQRQSDVLKMTWADYDGQGIQVLQQKTKESVWVPCHSDLKEYLEAWKRNRTATTIVVNSLGNPYSLKSFHVTFPKEKKKHIELNGLVFHGLRKTAAAKLAEAGCSSKEIMAITGHKTLAMVEEYTREADQKTQAMGAIVKLENAFGKRRKMRG